MADENHQSYNVTLLLLSRNNTQLQWIMQSRQPTAPSTIPNLVARLNRTTRLQKFSHHGRLHHQKWCADPTRGYRFRGMFSLILTTFFWLLLAGAGANSGCDQLINNCELLALSYAKMAHRLGTVKFASVIKDAKHLWSINYSDPDSECK